MARSSAHESNAFIYVRGRDNRKIKTAQFHGVSQKVMSVWSAFVMCYCEMIPVMISYSENMTDRTVKLSLTTTSAIFFLFPKLKLYFP